MINCFNNLEVRKIIFMYFNTKLFVSTLLAQSLLFTSCIKDEAADTDADILEAQIPSEYLKTEPIITNTSVEFKVKSTIDLTKQSPIFIISPNATISPVNGTERDYSKTQYVTVTAEDMRWSKVYSVNFTVDDLNHYYNFNQAELTDRDRYYRFYEVGANGNKIYEWDSGNQGYATIAGSTPPENYPTSVTQGRKGGKAVKMVTVYTDKMGESMGNPIAAGNLFIGTFKLNIFNPLKSTRFGLPFDGGLPKKLRGVYTYKAGDVVTDKNYKPIPGKKDDFIIYAILFESRAKDNYLDGTHKFMDSRNVAIAKIQPEQRKETTKWTTFETPFELVKGKTFDPTKEYMLTIVMSSSINGDEFEGAVGSTLVVDEIELLLD